MSLDNLPHVELAHLDFVGRELLEELLHAVDYYTSYGVATLLNAAYGILVILHFLVLDEGHIKRLPTFLVKGKQHAPVLTPVGRVQVDKSPSLTAVVVPTPW